MLVGRDETIGTNSADGADGSDGVCEMEAECEKN